MLTSTLINIRDISIKNIASNLTIIPFEKISKEIDLINNDKPPKAGDVALFRVSQKNTKMFITMQDLEGRLIDLYPGDYIVCPFASRDRFKFIIRWGIGWFSDVYTSFYGEEYNS